MVSPGFTIEDKDESFSADPQSIWMQTDIDAIINGIYNNGVASGGAVTPQGVPDMTVHVAVGSGYSAGSAVSWSAGDPAIGAADGSNPRIDLVVITSGGAIAVRAGAAATSAKAPDPTAGDILLAFVLVPAAASSIIATYITDKRVFRPDHASLIGLTTGDAGHTQFALLAGRAAGQQLYGGTGSGDDLVLSSTSNASKGHVGVEEAVGFYVFSGWSRFGGGVPTNTGDGDVTAARLFVPNATIDSEARLVQFLDTYTPGVGGASHSLHVEADIDPGAADTAEVRAAKFKLAVSPTATVTAVHRAFYAEASHGAGAFGLSGELTGFFAQAIQNVGATTVASLNGAKAAYRAAAGTVTTAIGLQITRGIVGDAGAIGTGVGLWIEASAGVTPTADVAIYSAGGANLFVGAARFGSSSSPTNNTDGDVTLLRLNVGSDTAFANQSIVQVLETRTPSTGFEYMNAQTLTSTASGGTSSDEIHTVLFQHNVQPTASTAKRFRAARFQIGHSSGAFDVTGQLIGLWAEADQNVGSTTAAEVIGGRAVYRAVAGTITTAVGWDVVKGTSGDAGSITTGIGVRVQASSGATPTNDISFYSTGTQHMRHVGGVMIGADAAPGGLEVRVAVSESAVGADSFRMGIASGTPRLVFEDSGFTIWEVDNSAGTFRFFTPGTVRMSLTTTTFDVALSVFQVSTAGAVAAIGTTGAGSGKFVLGGTVATDGTNSFGMYMGALTFTMDANNENAYGFYAGGVVATGTFTGLTAYSAFIEAQTKTGTGTVATAYGVYIKKPTIGTANYYMGFDTANTAAAGTYAGKLPIVVAGAAKFLHYFN